jgi:hypothetical protein
MTQTANPASTTSDQADHSADSHVSGHGKSRYDDIPVSGVLYYGAIAVVVTLLSILFVKGLLNAWTRSFEAKRQAEIVESPASIEIAKQQKILEGGEGTLSIEEASKKALEKYGTKAAH